MLGLTGKWVTTQRFMYMCTEMSEQRAYHEWCVLSSSWPEPVLMRSEILCIKYAYLSTNKKSKIK